MSSKSQARRKYTAPLQKVASNGKFQIICPQNSHYIDMADYENLRVELEKERYLRIEAEKRVKLLETELFRLSSSARSSACQTVTVVEHLIGEKTHMEKELEQLKHDMTTMRMEREKVSTVDREFYRAIIGN